MYNTVLHLNSAQGNGSGLRVESLAFLPQVFLSVGAIPYLLAKKDLASTMLAQTFAFVTFNKVCTSQVRLANHHVHSKFYFANVGQYFLWYMVFLPFYLPNSSLIQRPRLGITALVLWVLGQAMWLQQGYRLEFLGESTFAPGLFLAGIVFFCVNCWILGIIVSDVGMRDHSEEANGQLEQKKAQ